MERFAHRALAPLIALLSLAVLLVGVFAMHSEITGHDHHSMPAGSVMAGHAHESTDERALGTASVTPAATTTTTAATPAVTATVTASATVAAALTVAVVSSGFGMSSGTVMSSATLSGLLDCALMAICAVLLIVLLHIVFTRRPVSHRHVLRAGRRIHAIMQTVVAPAAAPSLTQLSIRRV